MKEQQSWYAHSWASGISNARGVSTLLFSSGWREAVTTITLVRWHLMGVASEAEIYLLMGTISTAVYTVLISKYWLLWTIYWPIYHFEGATNMIWSPIFAHIPSVSSKLPLSDMKTPHLIWTHYWIFRTLVAYSICYFLINSQQEERLDLNLWFCYWVFGDLLKP